MAISREEALKLLRGGEEGVAEWNRRRRAGEEIPDLRMADLRCADLSGADLRGVTGLTRKQLQEARNWEFAYRDPELACGADIPQE